MPDASPFDAVLQVLDKYGVYGLPILIIAFFVAYKKPLLAAMGSFSRDLQIEAMERNTAQFAENNRLFHALFGPVTDLGKSSRESAAALRDIHSEQKIQTDQLRAISAMININSEILRGFRK